MNSKKLSIKQLSHSGQVLRTITCHSGQVSVFRALTPSDLKPYQRALSGLPGPERILISVEDEPFFAFEHNLIGFGEQFEKGTPALSEFLVNSGVPQDALLGVCSSFGLEDYLQTSCGDLAPAEARMARLLAATYDQTKILVLNDPFECIPLQWRERYADMIVNFARTRNALVVITALSSRPESWIDNEQIVRIQVGETRQRTIGLATAPNEIREALEQLRAEAKLERTHSHATDHDSNATTHAVAASTAAMASAAAVAPTELTQQASHSLLDTLRAWLPSSSINPLYFAAPVIVAGMIGLGYVTLQSDSSQDDAAPLQTTAANEQTAHLDTTSEQSSSQPVSAELPVANDNQVNVVVPGIEQANTIHNPMHAGPVEASAGAEHSGPSTGSIAVVPVVVTEEPGPLPALDSVLDEYPSEIRASIMLSYEGQNVTLPSDPFAASAAKPEAFVRTRKSSGELLGLLEQASEKPAAQSGAPTEATFNPPQEAEAPETTSNETFDEESWEKRREMMRQRFLESIQAASAEG